MSMVDPLEVVENRCLCFGVFGCSSSGDQSQLQRIDS